MRTRYQASIFADFMHVEANVDNTIRILTSLSKRGLGLLPSTIQELTPPTMRATPRLRFSLPKGESEVVVASNRLDFIKQGSPMDGEGLGTVKDFELFVEQCVAAVFENVSTRKGARLAFLVQAFQPESDPDVLNGRFSKLFRPLPTFRKHLPKEWTFRANAELDLKFGALDERVNAIVKTERLQGRVIEPNGVWKEFDRELSEFDINTLPGNTADRFEPDALIEFVRASSVVVSQLEEELSIQLEAK